MDEEKVILNLSGSKYEISTDTLSEIKSLDSAASEMLKSTSQSKSNELFIEWHSEYFPSILGYFQGRKLHMPLAVCPLDFKDELEFWGVDASNMSKCCFSRYCTFFDEQGVLTILEYDEKRRIDNKKALQNMAAETGWRSFQAKCWMILEEPSSSILAKVYFVVSAVFVMTSIFALVSGTHPSFKRSLTVSEWKGYFGDEYYKYEGHFTGTIPANTTLPPLPAKVKTNIDALEYIEYITVVYFTIELIVRIIFCPSKIEFFKSFLNLVDIFALIVMYSKYVVNFSNPKEKYTRSIFDIIHCLQIVRVFRLFRLVKNFSGFRVLLYAVRASAFEVLLMSMFLLVAMLMFGAFVFFSGDTTFPSIPDSFWWAVVTMTTVGYGDMVPHTGLSKLIGGVCAVTGVCLIAVIIPIFVNNFILFYTYSKIWNRQDKTTKTNKDRKSSISSIESNKVSPVKNETSSVTKIQAF